MEMNFCRRCGTELAKKDANTFRCRNNHLLFINSAPTVGVFLIDEYGNLLVSRRGVEPGKGMLDSIGGFVDGLESAEEATVRELEEETGLTPDDYGPLEFVCTASATNVFGGENRYVLSTFFATQLRAGAQPVANDDVADIVTLSLDNIDLELFHGEDVKAGLQALQELVLED